MPTRRRCGSTPTRPAAILHRIEQRQSAIASEPSRMPSVSRKGEATEPASMIAADHNRRLQLATTHQPVDGDAEFGALAVAQPANTRRQPLKLDAFLRQRQPAR